MSDSYSNAGQLAKVVAGFKGGQMFQNPIPTPKLRFVDGHPPEVTAKSGHSPFKQATPGKITG